MRQRTKNRGVVLVEALLIIAGLVALIAVLAANQHVSLQETQGRLRERRAQVAARSAIAQAMATLQSATPGLVTMNDDWALLGDSGNREFTLGDNATFRVQIVDAAAMLNVNTVTEDQLTKLPLTQEQIDSLLDWRETDRQARPSGAKDDYYNQLTEPYNTRLAPLTTVNELLLVRGWTAHLLYEPADGNSDTQTTVSTALPLQDANGNTIPLISIFTVDSGVPNQRSDGSARINLGAAVNANTLTQFGIDAATAQRIAGGGPYTNFATLLAEPGIPQNSVGQLLDAVAFSNADRVTGKININTASASVLQTLPSMTQDIAAAIVARQGVGGFNNLSDLTSIPGVTSGILPLIADSVTVGSDTWIVRAEGVSSGVIVAIEAVVGIRNAQARILTWQQVPGSSIPKWWGWETEPTSTVEAGQAQ